MAHGEALVERAAERPLSPRERQVATLAARGWSNKRIAYELGIDVSTVGFHLRGVSRKLLTHSRVDLVRKARAYTVGAGVQSAPEACGSICPSLSDAERGVVRLALAGLSNIDIARTRGRSERTVANQVASAFRKLRVGSRSELAATQGGLDTPCGHTCRSCQPRLAASDPDTPPG